MSRRALQPGEHGRIGFTKTQAGTFEARTLYCDPRGRRRVITATGATKGAAERRLHARIAGAAASLAPGFTASRGNDGGAGRAPSSSAANSSWTSVADARTGRVTVDDGGVTGGMTIADLGRRFLAEAERYGSRRGGNPLRPQTLAGYDGALQRQIVPLIGELRLEHLTVRLLEQVLAEENERGRSTELMRGLLKQMFDLAIRDGVFASNPIIHARSQTRPRGEVRALTPQQAVRLVELLDPARLHKPGAHRGPNGDLRDVVLFGLATGCRIGEILALHWTEVDLDGDLPIARIEATLVEPRKGFVTTLTRQQAPKTRDSRRTLVLPEVAVAMLRRRLNGARLESPYVFASRTGGPLWPNNVRTRLRAALFNHADLVGTTPHTLRRTVASHVFACDGLEASAVQLGHHLPGVTAQSYVARRERDLRETLSLLLPREGEAGAAQA